MTEKSTALRLVKARIKKLRLELEAVARMPAGGRVERLLRAQAVQGAFGRYLDRSGRHQGNGAF